MAPRIETLTVRNLRSVGDSKVTLRFPESGALVLLGENNAGKSNVTRALDIIFGDIWPGNKKLDEHDFHGRDSDGLEVEVSAQVSGVPCGYCRDGEVRSFKWTFDPQDLAPDGNPTKYRFACSNRFCDRSFVKGEMRSALSAAVLDANRRLDYQLSYASKVTMLSKLMHRFHERLLESPMRKQRLAEIFADLRDEFNEVPEFAAFQKLLADTAEDFGQNLPYRLDVDFSAYDPSNFFRSLRIHPKLSGEVRSFDELGTGQSQVLALAFAYAFAKAYGKSEGTILVIDEPESNLHPLAQQWLASRLNGLSAPGLQVVVTTHSPHFVDLTRPENLVMVSKGDDGATRVVQRSRVELHAALVERGADAVRSTPDTIGQFYAAAATSEIVSGLFARRCVLVEGLTEALALPELLRSRGLDVLREGIAVVPVEGIGNIAKWYRLFTALGIPCFCIFDSDSDKGGRDANDLLAKRHDISAALGREGDPAAPAVESGDPLYVGDGYAVLNPNFEGAMRALFPAKWSELDELAVASVGVSKPLRARYTAKRLLPEDYAVTPGLKVDALARATRGGERGEATPDDPRSEPTSPWPPAADPWPPVADPWPPVADPWPPVADPRPSTDPWASDEPPF
ncbi:ATP-dependent endonuclease [Promicromonospora sp. NPDC057488]|uniref:ATP-dependent nuclease n=1 Tax=Promicromonospora sp. NPDC057488 TaxID=3346147 RepID=UPI00366BC5D9